MRIGCGEMHYGSIEPAAKRYVGLARLANLDYPLSASDGAASGMAACGRCHESRKPRDELHQDVGAGCGLCHTTDRWRTTTFDHARFPVFDANHPARCASCHPDAFDRYSCYGCHAHTPAFVAMRHREVHAVDRDDCAGCHLTSDPGARRIRHR